LAKLRYQHTLAGMDGGDRKLPMAHTCYFTLDVPEYTDKEIFRKRLLTAIRFCGEVDGDRDMTRY